MCINPLSGLGLAGQALKSGGPAAFISPALALAGAFKKKKKQPGYGGGPNPDGSMSTMGG